MKRTRTQYDAVIIGSGINSMVAAALLAKAGWAVCVVERNEYLGGAVQTADITLPGFRHDVFSGWHILFHDSPAHKLLAEELAETSLNYVNAPMTAGVVTPDGSSAFISRSMEENLAEFAKFGDDQAWQSTCEQFRQQADITLSLLGTELLSRSGFALGLHAIERLHLGGAIEFAGHALSTARDWLEESFTSELSKALIAPWVLHTGLGPESATSGLMLKTMAVMLQEVGVPIPVGGGARLIEALATIIEKHGGACFTGQDIDEVIVEDNRAVGVLASDGEEVRARFAVIGNVTPTQLYTRLLRNAILPEQVLSSARGFRYGRADMQIHFALARPLTWKGDERLCRTPVINLTPGLDGVSKAVNEAVRGLIPAQPTICVGQPTLVDPSRAPDGQAILWIQLLEMPRNLKGDAAGEINTGGGIWSEHIREAVADRVQQAIARHTEGFPESILKRVSLSPADLASRNINLVGGDPYSGSCEISQNLLFRPLAGQPSHETPIKDLFHIGASTWPGPGLSGSSGMFVAERLVKKHRLAIRFQHAS